MAKKPANIQVAVEYPLNWYFEDDYDVDKFIRKTFRFFGTTDSSSGAGFGNRDVCAWVSEISRGNAIKEYLELFPGLKVTVYPADLSIEE